MAQAVQDVSDEEMIDNCDEQKDDLRMALYMLLNELKRIGTSIVPEVENFLAATFAQPAREPTTFLQKNSPTFSKLLQTSPNVSKLLKKIGDPLEKLEKLSPMSELPLYRELYFQHVFNFQQTRLG
jgi:hypothetical protein